MKRLLFMAALLGTASAQTLTDRFFDEFYFPLNPTTATASGIHKYDGEVEDYSRAAIENRVARLKEFEAAFAKLPASADRDVILTNIRSGLLELETVRSWEKNPDFYSSSAATAVYTIMSRTFAPPEARLRALVSREKKLPQMLAAARANLKNPPRIYTEIALEQLPGIAHFFESDVPLAFPKISDAALLADFKASNARVAAALRDYEKYLRSEVLPKSNGDYRLGADVYTKKLLYDEMVDIPLDRLLQIGYSDLHANQKKLRDTAALIDKNKTPQQIMADIEKDHPAADHLLDAYRDTTRELREYVTAHKIVTLPSPVLPILQETPPFARALTTASMDIPGAFETVAKEAYFNVTLPEKNWPPDRLEDFMRGQHRGTILSTAIHEAYPGHYTQFLWVQQIQSRVRKLLGANTNVEGWAHYCEQMMMDEGYTSDPRLRLGQIQDALLRDARYIVGIEMHTGRRTFDQSVDFFMKEGFQTHEVAVKETKRGTADPTYLYYTLGKLEILKLREDYRRAEGARFSLQHFHDEFLKQGFPPIPIVRKAMLGNDSPAL